MYSGVILEPQGPPKPFILNRSVNQYLYHPSGWDDRLLKDTELQMGDCCNSWKR